MIKKAVSLRKHLEKLYFSNFHKHPNKTVEISSATAKTRTPNSASSLPSWDSIDWCLWWAIVKLDARVLEELLFSFQNVPFFGSISNLFPIEQNKDGCVAVILIEMQIHRVARYYDQQFDQQYISTVWIDTPPNLSPLE